VTYASIDRVATVHSKDLPFAQLASAATPHHLGVCVLPAADSW